DCDDGTFSPDGSQIAYGRSGRDANDGIYITRADGQGEPRRLLAMSLTTSFARTGPWTPDGRAIIANVVMEGRFHLALLPVSGGSESKPARLIRGLVDEVAPELSPDGHRLAFMSGETGRHEIYVCDLHPDGTCGDPVRVTNGGGENPSWAGNG